MRLAAYTAETYGYCYMREYSLTNEITEEHLDKLDSTKYDWDNDDGTTIIMDIDTIRSCTFTQSVKRNQLRIEMNFRGPLPAESGSEPGSGDEERVMSQIVDTTQRNATRLPKARAPMADPEKRPKLELPSGCRNFQFTLPHYTLLSYESGGPLSACGIYRKPFGQQPIPNHMLEALSDLAKQHAFDYIHCQAIRIDNNFIDKLLPLLNGSVSLRIQMTHLDKSLDFQKLANFLLSSKSKSIELTFPRMPDDVDFETAFLGIFDETFWTTFANGCVEDALKFWLQYRNPKSPYHWVASRNLFPILCRFESFMLRSMKMHPSHVVEFILNPFTIIGQEKLVRTPNTDRNYAFFWVMRLSDFNNHSELHFSITEELAEVHLSKIDLEKYDASRENIRKIGTPNGCHIRTSDESGRLIIDLRFYQRKTDNSESGSGTGSEPDSDNESGSGSDDDEELLAPVVA
ncbi:hypothetical protein PRIPAC_86752 [Pristionchus pacificus]|uniref:Uncharacterized protein n=1 Tax=Pristionchus pacificus TaxID=54126 RepID=A0A2A6BN45_PRIPA|nr:hypothetical protein PRIPAC_86752 [Pristionchus pacificus]|eukprot:PDM67337.1 hypothetical protein PRIPAC_48754 [Pristionchus pacificus]